jgi:hypothetical protein
MSPVVRAECGTLRGVLAHQANGEPWCGWCSYAEQAARIAAERLVPPPPPVAMPAAGGGRLPWVTAAQAARNAAVLNAEVAAYEAGRPLRPVPPPDPGSPDRAA